MSQRLAAPIGRLSQAMIVLGICAAIVVGFINARHLLVLRQVEDQLLSARFELRGPIPADRNIEIVLLEKDQLTTPSVILTNVTEAIEHLTKDETSVIVVDQTLMDYVTAGKFSGNDPAITEAFIATLSKSDRIFVPYKFTLDSTDKTDVPEAISETAYRVYRFRDDLAPKLPLNPQAVMAPPREILAESIPGHETEIDDGTMHRQFAYPVIGFKGEYLPSLAIEASTSFLNLVLTDVSVFFGSGLQLGSNYIPTDSSMQMALNYRGAAGSYQYRTISEILTAPETEDKFGIVLLGAVTTDQQATSATPFDQALPNIEVLATSIDNMVNSDPLDRSQQVIILDIVLIAFLGVFFALLATLRSGMVVLTLGLLMGGLIAVLNFKAFTLINLWLNLTFPLGTIILCAGYLYFAKSISNKRILAIEEAEKEDVGKYAAPWIAERVRKAKNVIAAEEAAAAAEEAALAQAMESQSDEEEIVLTEAEPDIEEGMEAEEEALSSKIEEDKSETDEGEALTIAEEEAPTEEPRTVIDEPLFMEKPSAENDSQKPETDEVKRPAPIEPVIRAFQEIATIDEKEVRSVDETDLTDSTVPEIVEEENLEADIETATIEITPDVVEEQIPEPLPVVTAIPAKAPVEEHKPAETSDDTEAFDPATYQFDVALLFVDLTGYEAANSILGPTRLAQVRHSLQGIVETIVSRHAGYADSFGGDGVIAIFGLPDSSMNDSINALRCARELTTEISLWHNNQALPNEVNLNFGIGMHYGQLSIDAGEDTGSGQLSITGEAISVVSHLEKMSVTHSKAVIASDAIVDQILTVGTSNELLNGFKPLPLQDVQSKGSRQRVWQWDGPEEA